MIFTEPLHQHDQVQIYQVRHCENGFHNSHMCRSLETEIIRFNHFNVLVQHLRATQGDEKKTAAGKQCSIPKTSSLGSYTSIVILLQFDNQLLTRGGTGFYRLITRGGVGFYRSTILFFVTKLGRNYFFTLWLWGLRGEWGLWGEWYYLFSEIRSNIFF